jgi:hypothetical protein
MGVMVMKEVDSDDAPGATPAVTPTPGAKK